MADHSLPGRRDHARRSTGPAPGRFTTADAAEAYRAGYRPDFPCRWCRVPTEMLDGGAGNVCRHCDLAEPWPG